MKSPLPIDDLLPEIIGCLREESTLVLEAPPGAGKTTRVPAALLDAAVAPGEVLVLEPRRIAARLAASRVAFERGERPGETVGWHVRFENVSSEKTRLRFLTEGVLVRRLLSDPDLGGVGAVFLDEFHERHLEGDLALALLRRLQKKRTELRLILMSATLDAASVADALGARLLRAEGRRFDVAIEYLPGDERKPLAERVANTLKRLVREGLDGDVLVFLPGAREIRQAEEACRELAQRSGLLLLPLHGRLPLAEQNRALAPAQERKVILSTNVAETSVTIEGVVAVVDGGLARVPSHAPWSGIPTLKLAKVSRASAAQRAGRAGRTRPGRCLRLYTRLDHDARPEHEEPEIRRADLAELSLTLLGSGLAPRDLDWLEAPRERAISASLRLLSRLGALSNGALSETGRAMLAMPLHPRLSRLILEANDRGAGEDACLIAALLSERDLRALEERDRRAEAGRSDLVALRDAYDRGHSPAIERMRRELVARRPSSRARKKNGDALLVATLAAFPDRVARVKGENLILAEGGTAQLARTSVVKGEAWLVAVDAEERREPGGASSVLVRLASAIEPEWLVDLFPDEIKEDTSIEWNAVAERVDVVTRLTYGALALEEDFAARGDPAEVAARLKDAALAVGPRAFCREGELERLLSRVAFVREACPDAGLDPLEEDDACRVLASLCDWRRSFEELRQADLEGALRATLGPKVPVLERLAPDSVLLPGGRSVRVEYEAQKPPWVASRLQDFFGARSGPTVAGGRVKLVLHLLAPNRRAVQVTTDLEGFWARAYPSVRKELARKYPKHAWPEDPLKASPRVPRK